MTSLTVIAAGPIPLSASPGVAVEALRSLARKPRGHEGDRGDVLPPCPARTLAEDAFGIFLAAVMPIRDSRAPCLAQPHSTILTRDERTLLRALAAAQAGDEMVLDNYLYRIALDRQQRARLAEAVRALAAALELAGVILPVTPALKLPAPALRVGVLHGLLLDDIDVSWPD